MITNPTVGRRVCFVEPNFGSFTNKLGCILVPLAPGYEAYSHQVAIVRFDQPVGMMTSLLSNDHARTDHHCSYNFLSYVDLTPEQEEQERINLLQLKEQVRLNLLQAEDQKRRLAHAMKFL